MKVSISLLLIFLIGLEIQILNTIDGVEKAHKAIKLEAQGLMELKERMDVWQDRCSMTK